MLFVGKHFLPLHRLSGDILSDIHIESVFALSFQENVEVFNESKDTTDNTHSCYRQGEVCPNGHACAPYLYECGVLHRLF